MAKIFWFDSEESNGGWDHALEDFHPTILITAWSTPPVPERYLQNPGCCLKYVCHLFGSVRQIVPRTFIASGGIVTNWGDLISAQVAEQALLLALGALRNMRRWDGFIRQQSVAPQHQARELNTKTLFGRKVGIHGFGRIARQLANLLKPFRVDLSAYSAGVPDAFMEAQGVKPSSSIHDLFGSNEVVFECEALTAETEKSVSASVLACLPDDAIFVNVGRGRTVDEDALLKEASSGRIRVALDVLANEPLTDRSPFFPVSNALLSPHIAGPTNDRYAACSTAALENVMRYLAHEPLNSVVSLADYDRST